MRTPALAVGRLAKEGSLERITHGVARWALWRTLAQLPSLCLGRAAVAWSAAKTVTPYPDVVQELAAIEGAAASQAEWGYPERSDIGTLGFAYASFLQAHNFTPPAAPRDISAMAPGGVLALRRALLHDVLHVLLGFSASWPGEIGVFSFVGAQRYCPQFERSARTLAYTYTTLAPWLRVEFQEAEQRGRALAAAAPRLLTLPLEREWNTPLASLQVRLKLKTRRKLPPAHREGGEAVMRGDA